MLPYDQQLIYKKELSLIEFYRKNPVIAAKDLLGVELAPPQQDILNSMWTKSYIVVSAGRGCGKTFISATFACLWALLWPGQKVGLLAPSFRQAKMMFAEVDKIWTKAPLLKEATLGKPTYASDKCYLKFRQAGSTPASVIEAVPLGDGNKIRGARYYCIVVDEFAQMPVEIFNAVILPMGATVANPMENVKKIAKMDELIKSGAASKDDFQEANANKIVMLSSAYYQFNHMYETMQKYSQAIEEGETKFAVHSVSFRQMPKGFLSEDNIRAAKSKLSQLQFNMEYEAIWEADSAGVFKATLIEKCKTLTGHAVQYKGTPGSEYVLGVDPARASDAFALTLLERGHPNKLVACWEYYKNEFPKMANIIMDICDKFNVIAIHLDAGAGGGGLAVKDLLAEEERFGPQRILDVEDDETVGQVGRRILHMFKPSSNSNASAIHATLSLLEQNNLALPSLPKSTDLEELDKLEPIHETVEEMLRQLMLIEVSQTRSGVAHFDIPTGGHGKQKKDLFSSFIMAAKKLYDLSVVTYEPQGILEIGSISAFNPGSRFDVSKRQSSLDSPTSTPNSPMRSWEVKKSFKP